jgi:hypothetical protein
MSEDQKDFCRALVRYHIQHKKEADRAAKEQPGPYNTLGAYYRGNASAYIIMAKHFARWFR